MLWLVGLTVAAAVLRVVNLNSQLWYQEIYAVTTSIREPMASLVTTPPARGEHVLYSLLAKLCSALLGESPWTLRLPAAVFGVACIPMAFAFARTIMEKMHALLVAALIAFSYHHLWFSQNAAGYTGLLFFTMLTTWALLRAQHREDWASGAIYVAGIALGTYLHFTMVSILASQALVFTCHAVAYRRRHAKWPTEGKRVGRIMGIAALGAIALHVPMLPEWLRGTALEVHHRATTVEWKNPLWTLLETLQGLSRATRFGWPAVAVAGILTSAGLIQVWRKSRYLAGLLVLPGFIAATMLMLRGYNLWPRSFLFVMGFALVILMEGTVTVCREVARRLGLSSRAAWRAGLAAGMLMVAASAWTVPAAYQRPKQDFLGAMHFVESARKPGERIAVVGLSVIPYNLYYEKDWNPVETLRQMHALRQELAPVWVLYIFPAYTKAEYPEVWAVVDRECPVVRVFPGTVGDGEVYVCRWEPV